MSDVMPYPSTRFSELTPEQLHDYEACFASRLQQAVRNFQPDIIHCNHLWLITSLTRRLFRNISVVATCHGSDIRQYLHNPHLRQQVKSGCRQLDAVFALSEAQRSEIATLYGIDSARIHVVGAGYDDTLFTGAGKPVPDTVRVAYAGKLANAKGVPWLLSAMEQLDDSITLDLCGAAAGPEKHAIEAHAQHLAPRVTLCGNLTHQQLAHVMREAHIFVLPSFHEGLPLVLLEALACNCRLVATRLPGIEEVFSSLPPDDMRLIPLPRMQAHEIPHCTDATVFIDNIAAAIAAHAMNLRRSDNAAPSQQATELLNRFSWRAVYQRIQYHYTTLV